MEGGKREYEHGDFLIRNLIGLDPDSGVIAIGDRLRNGLVVQFHLRDATTSALDLRTMLARYRTSLSGGAPRGAMLFSCLGRGMHLYGEPHHDSRVIADQLGDLPIGGFFCGGEIGPVGGRTYVHGYTSAIALFRPKSTH
jgi:small ligand-binding sensory domain FIST